MKFLLYILFIFSFAITQGQGFENPIPDKLKLTDNVPAELLAKRSVVFHSANLSDEELETTQSSFQKTGIDAVAYFKTEFVFAGLDVTQKIIDYLGKREISFIILISKKTNRFSFITTPFNGNSDFVNQDQIGWEVDNANLSDALQIIYRYTVNSQPIKNLLINSYPEKNFPITIIEGRRSDFFAIDLKVDHLAVPWFKDAVNDSLLVKFFKETYPFTYNMVEPGLDKKELRSKGFHYLLSYVHTDGAIARDILGYQNTSNESAITSVTYPNGSLKLKTLSAETPVYKFYLKHLESGNVFLGTKWDADITWESALRNHIKGFRAELKIP
ncbi:MAG: hypothetical protein RIA63_06870 [Cyclobacteriaceae bacterium]